MNGRAAYLDASAFVKLLVPERESRALRRYLERWPRLASSAVTRTEAVRALRRSGYEDRVVPARRLLKRMSLIRIDEPLLDRAADLSPPELRTMDAVHLAAALTLGDDLGVLLTYDARLAQAAETTGLTVEAPR